MHAHKSPPSHPARPTRRRVLGHLAGGAAAVLAAAMPALATTQKPMRIVVPFPPGGGTDVMGRLLAQGMQDVLGTTIIVDNVPGATGTLGSGQVARARPDGRTLLLGISATHAIAPALLPALTYKPERDFAAIGRIAAGGNMLAVNPDYPPKTVQELIAYTRASGQPLMYGSWGNGSGGHLAAESIRKATGIDMQHVPYKGVAQLLQELAGGQIKVAVVDMAGGLPLVAAGRIRAMSVTGSKRSSALPQLPTLRESGIPFGTDSWYAMFTAAGVPAAQVRTLEQALTQSLQRPEVVARIRSIGMEPEIITPEAFRKQWHADIGVWAELVRSSGARAE